MCCYCSSSGTLLPRHKRLSQPRLAREESQLRGDTRRKAAIASLPLCRPPLLVSARDVASAKSNRSLITLHLKLLESRVRTIPFRLHRQLHTHPPDRWRCRAGSARQRDGSRRAPKTRGLVWPATRMGTRMRTRSLGTLARDNRPEAARGLRLRVGDSESVISSLSAELKGLRAFQRFSVSAELEWQLKFTEIQLPLELRRRRLKSSSNSECPAAQRRQPRAPRQRL